MKIANLILGVLFVLFAAVQYNDPDAWLWIVIYGAVAVAFFLAAAHRYSGLLYGAILVACIYEAVTLAPDFSNWIEMGTPNIATEMKTEEPHIELVREFLGVLITLGAVLFLFWQSRRRFRGRKLS